MKQKLLKEYGVDNIAKIPEIKERMLMTRFETQGSFLQDYKYYYDECYKIIDPIKLGISSNQKADRIKGTKSGKSLIKKYSHSYNTLFDNDDSFNL